RRPPRSPHGFASAASAVHKRQLEEQGPVYFYKGCDVTASAETNISRAIEIAQKADIVVFVGGTNLDVSDESHDRTSLNLPGDQQKLLEAVHAVNPNVVLVLETCSSVTIPWAQENIPAIVEAWYDGQAQGKAIADVLYGDYNPSGKLTSTWYKSISDLPAGMLEYNIRKAGYTYMYHTKTPLYPFGFGLSYTTFDYSDFNLSSTKLDKDGSITATATITNTGKVAGAEVVQLYATCKSQIERPQLQLIGFTRVELEPGESKDISITFNHDQLTYFNSDKQTFDVEEGTAEIHLAASSADIRHTASITTEGATVKITHLTDQTGIDDIVRDRALDSNIIYNLSGQAVGQSDDFNRLPAGFYIVGNQKIVKK
ncbi:MAG: glycoside hydrolase family 3 C-terminal domain-containing protein, partial [Duncaniella sp.]|nr:glycoside hydrolase family 3 C-terminal domain-containing protein [Duncaniella sp.]